MERLEFLRRLLGGIAGLFVADKVEAPQEKPPVVSITDYSMAPRFDGQSDATTTCGDTYTWTQGHTDVVCCYYDVETGNLVRLAPDGSGRVVAV